MIKYFVSFTYNENGQQEYGWITVESEHYFTSEQDLVEVTELLKKQSGNDRPIILNFQIMANANLSMGGYQRDTRTN